MVSFMLVLCQFGVSCTRQCEVFCGPFLALLVTKKTRGITGTPRVFYHS